MAHEQQADSIEQAQQLSRTRYFWWINYLTDYTGWDFLWEPVPWEAHQRHAWPSQWQKDAGTYLVSKDKDSGEIHYRQDKKLIRKACLDNWDNLHEGFDYSWHPDITEQPYIYQFGTQWQKTGGPVFTLLGATETKYISEPRANKTSVDNYWVVPDTVDAKSFDFTWHPDATEGAYIYQFGTQHQRTGGPKYVVPGASDLKFCDQVRGSVKSGIAPIIEINHMDGNAGQVPGAVSTVRYFDNYKDVLTRIANTTDNEYVWIVSSICDYSNFDFSWHPELWQNTMLHVFASDGEKFGDTFYMHVPSFKKRIGQFELLDWYDVNFINVSVPRRPIPIIEHSFDTHVKAVQTQDWAGPLALFSTGNPPVNIPTVPLWREKTKTVVPLSAGGTQTIVPKTAVPWVKEQLYDYPFVDKTQRHWYQDTESDVVFISNGETMADANWRNLLQLCPRAKRSDGVLGREAAYKAAAEMSTTPWFFAVFAKTEVLPTFKFDYQPDRLQQPKHYIFHSRNPLNGLEYGAMNINLYNRQLTIDTRPGIDFTLSSLHTVVPIVASISRFNTDPWVTWRSSFREVLKLKLEVDQGADLEIQHRLKVWCTRAEGDNAEHCLAGANDALEYYAEVLGDYDKLCLSFDWDWLQEFYYRKYRRKIWLELV